MKTTVAILILLTSAQILPVRADDAPLTGASIRQRKLHIDVDLMFKQYERLTKEYEEMRLAELIREFDVKNDGPKADAKPTADSIAYGKKADFVMQQLDMVRVRIELTAKELDAVSSAK